MVIHAVSTVFSSLPTLIWDRWSVPVDLFVEIINAVGDAVDWNVCKQGQDAVIMQDRRIGIADIVVIAKVLL